MVAGGRHGTLVDSVLKSPKKYSTAFRSDVPRFRDGSKGSAEQGRDFALDNRTNTIEWAVTKSPVKVSTMANTTQRGSASQKVQDKFYDTDAGNKASLAKSVRMSPRRYPQSEGERFKASNAPVSDVFYNVDGGSKKSLQRSVNDSPRKYRIMDTNARDRPVLKEAEPGPMYNVNNKTFENSIKTSPRKYSVFNSRSCRTEYSIQDGPGAIYNPRPPEKSLNNAAAIVPFRSTAERVTSAPASDGPAFMTDVDSGNKTSLWSSIQRSNQSYPTLRTNARDRPITSSGMPVPKLWDLYYDADALNKSSTQRNVLNSSRAYSCFNSNTPRFPQAEDQAFGAVYNTDTSYKMSLSRSVATSRRTYRQNSPRFPKKAYTASDSMNLVYNPDVGSKETLTTGVMNSARSYSNMRSVIPRFETIRRERDSEDYESLLKNPERGISLRFEVRGNVVVKKAGARTAMVVARNQP